MLKIRALFEDYGNNVLADDALVEAVDIIKEAKEYSGREMNVLSKDGIKQAKKSGDKALVKAAKKEYNLKAQENEKIEISVLSSRSSTASTPRRAWRILKSRRE